MSVRLVQIAPGQEQVFTLEEGKTTLGRNSDNQIQLVFGSVSRHHVKLTVTGESCRLEDMGSSNGTRVNGRTSTGIDLKDGDEIGIGECVFRFEHVQDSESARAEFVPRVFSHKAQYATVKMKPISPITPSTRQKIKQAASSATQGKWWNRLFRRKEK